MKKKVIIAWIDKKEKIKDIFSFNDCGVMIMVEDFSPCDRIGKSCLESPKKIKITIEEIEK